MISGGTGASKTYSILMILISDAQANSGWKIDVVAESFPHLEDGAIRDFKEIMISTKFWRDESWNETKHTYNFKNGSVIKFLSVDKLGKAHGPRRDVLFLNECNYITFQIADQLITRTRKHVWLDYNPTQDFWVYPEIINKRKDVEFLKLTYLDNEALSPEELAEIEGRRNNKNWWRVYGEGELGEIEGKIYNGWEIIDEVPKEARLERYGLDFGYTNDPTAIVAIYYLNGGYILDEECYLKGLANKQIADILANILRALVLADSAEPKSIDEIRSFGINIIACDKGPDSVRHGIKLIQDQRISVTKRSVNLIKEYRNYQWKIDRNGVVLPIPEDLWNHGLDAIRYAISSLVPLKRRAEYIRSLPIPPQFLGKPQNPAI